MIDDSYFTIKEQSTGLYKEKGSKFIALAFPLDNEDEIKTHLENVKREYHDARHHCYAYLLGKDGEDYRANDDGEPNHSAGDPILGQMRSVNLTNVLIIVVRYFGGTKLGVGGLINAYKTAAADAIANSTIVEGHVTRQIEVKFEYLSMNEVMKLIKDYNCKVVEQHFDNACKILINIRLAYSEELEQKLSGLKNVEVRSFDVP